METERTGWHRKVEKWIEGRHRYDSEVTDFSPYKLDVYLPDVHACIEIDGPVHSRKRDAIRDDVMLEQYGVVTLRLAARKGLRKADTISRIEDFIRNWLPSKDERYQVFTEGAV